MPWNINCTNYWVDECFTREYPSEAFIPDSGEIRRAMEAGEDKKESTKGNLQLIRDNAAKLVAQALE